MKLLFMLLGFLVLSAFSEHPVTPPSNVQLFTNSASKPTKVISVTFAFDNGSCHYTVVVAFETTTGVGGGEMTRRCGTGPTQAIYFRIGNGVLNAGPNPDDVVLNAVDGENFSDFTLEDESYTPSADEMQNLVDGYNGLLP